jgi:hypothetical protein
MILNRMMIPKQASGNDPTAAIIDVEDFVKISWFLFLAGISISFFSYASKFVKKTNDF